MLSGYPYFKESSFPSDYRKNEVDLIHQVIQRQRSLVVTGLSGMGRSNLIRFFVSHPEIQNDKFLKIFIDCQSARNINELFATLIDELSRRANFEPVPMPDLADLWSLKKSLNSQLQKLANSGKYLVIVFHHFEVFLIEGQDFLNQLKLIRETYSKKLSYIFSIFHFSPTTSLRDLEYLLDAKSPLWITPLNEKDAFESLERDGERLSYHFSDVEKKTLFSWSGGHPGLLRELSEQVVNKPPYPPGLDPEEAIKLLLEKPNILRECNRLWESLDHSAKEQLAFCLPTTDGIDEATKKYLLSTGIGIERQNEPFICSLIFYIYLQSYIVGRTEFVKIRKNKVYVGDKECELTNQPFLLLELLLERRGQLVPYAEIAKKLWPDEIGIVQDNRIPTIKYDLVSALSRIKVKDYIKTHTSRGLEWLVEKKSTEEA